MLCISALFCYASLIPAACGSKRRLAKGELRAETDGDAVGFYRACGFVPSRRVDGMYHGTGDVYASVLLTCLLNSRSLRDSAEFACRFTAKCVEVTKATMPDVNYGVRFEAVLPELMREIEL